jgi:hypothetical protein
MRQMSTYAAVPSPIDPRSVQTSPVCFRAASGVAKFGGDYLRLWLGEANGAQRFEVRSKSRVFDPSGLGEPLKPYLVVRAEGSPEVDRPTIVQVDRGQIPDEAIPHTGLIGRPALELELLDLSIDGTPRRIAASLPTRAPSEPFPSAPDGCSRWAFGQSVPDARPSLPRLKMNTGRNRRGKIFRGWGAQVAAGTARLPGDGLRSEPQAWL